MDWKAVSLELEQALQTIPSIGSRTSPHPVDDIAPPWAFVAYPDDIAYDGGYGRGMDRITGNVIVLASGVTSEIGWELISGYTNGGGEESVKTAIEKHEYSTLDTVRVTSAEFDTLTIAGIAYVGSLFELDIVGRGA